MNQKKRVIILEHGGGELSNQLWNFISLYAYCRERGYEFENYSFFEYAPWFRIPVKNRFVRLCFVLPFIFLGKLGGYRTMAASLPFRLLKKAARFKYKWYAGLVKALHRDGVVSSDLGAVQIGLPFAGNILDQALERRHTAYCTGWLFRNHMAIVKYREEIKEYLQPEAGYRHAAAEVVGRLKKQYQHVIGVHIRQRNTWDTPLTEAEDRAAWAAYEAKPFFYESHFPFINRFLRGYCESFRKDPAKTCFVICSNKPVEPSDFPGLNCVFNAGVLIEDILTLASCDSIIGSNSTLSAFASWWGNLPLVVIQEHPDWGYYADKAGYFENKYLSAVHY